VDVVIDFAQNPYLARLSGEAAAIQLRSYGLKLALCTFNTMVHLWNKERNSTFSYSKQSLASAVSTVDFFLCQLQKKGEAGTVAAADFKTVFVIRSLTLFAFCYVIAANVFACNESNKIKKQPQDFSYGC
jgi:hypothetical protein